jgi:hypothetical protein
MGCKWLIFGGWFLVEEIKSGPRRAFARLALFIFFCLVPRGIDRFILLADRAFLSILAKSAISKREVSLIMGVLRRIRDTAKTKM